MKKNKKKSKTLPGQKYPAYLILKDGVFVVEPKVAVYKGIEMVKSIVLEDISEMVTGIPVGLVFNALSGEKVEVLYNDTNILHRVV